MDKNINKGNINARGHIIVGDNNIINSGPKEISAEELTSTGIRLLKQKSYESAMKVLNQAIEKNSSNPDVYFYLALATIAGRRPKTLTPNAISAIEKNLDLAIEKNNLKSHFFYLKAIILYDYYYQNGYSIDCSEINELLGNAEKGRYDESMIEEMLRHMPGIDKNIVVPGTRLVDGY